MRGLMVSKNDSTSSTKKVSTSDIPKLGRFHVDPPTSTYQKVCR